MVIFEFTHRNMLMMNWGRDGKGTYQWVPARITDHQDCSQFRDGGAFNSKISLFTRFDNLRVQRAVFYVVVFHNEEGDVDAGLCRISRCLEVTFTN